jgi:23S rRNA pseudouridine1911/1915/1917 synthase
MSKQFQFRISKQDAGQRLDVFLASRLGQLSRIRIANLLAADACLVNQQTEKAGYHIAVDDLVEMTLDDSVSTSMSAENIPLEILYEDEQIIIVVKPSGMLVHPNKNTKSGTLANALAYHLNRLRIADCGLRVTEINAAPEIGEAADAQTTNLISQQVILKNQKPDDIPQSQNLQSATHNPQFQAVVRPGLVHRLDRATSGLMVVAKTQKALSILTTHFHKRLVKKLYLAVVEGCIKEDTGSIIAPIGHDESKRPPRWVMTDGKYAETCFRVLERRNGATLVELEPVTGRTNQLRIHCAYLGHSIVGDEIYGRAQVTDDRVQGEQLNLSIVTPDDSGLAKLPDEEINPVTCHLSPVPYSRLCLHAAQLEFHHPVGGRWMQFQAALPKEIEQIWDSFTGA